MNDDDKSEKKFLDFSETLHIDNTSKFIFCVWNFAVIENIKDIPVF